MRDLLIEMLGRKPFQPFHLVLTSGDRYEVTNPYLIALGQTMIVYAYPRSDRLARLRLNQLAALHDTESAA